MTIYHVIEGIESEADYKSDDQGYVVASIDRNFTITLDVGTNQNPITVKAFANLPTKGSPHPSNFLFICRDVKVRRVSVCFYTATATYVTPAKQDDSEDPTTDSAEISFSSMTTQEPIETDIEGNAIENTAGAPIKGVTADISDLTCTISKKVRNFDPTSIYTYASTVNSDEFLGFPAGTAKITSISANRVVDTEGAYFKLTVVIQFRKPYRDTTDEQAWYARTQNVGRYFIGKDGKETRATFGKNKIAVTQPVNLNESGGRLNANGKPIILYWPRNQTRKFSELGLL
jgi:hypothetical protein